MAEDPFIGREMGGLRFERLLGRGAMGAVYQGVQLALDRAVAIKVIAAHLADDADYVERFMREAKTLGRLHHPHVIACHDVVRTTTPEGRPLLAMVLEYVDGWSLGKVLAAGRLTAREAVDLHRQAAEGLAAAHAMGIVHRDVKPDNIMVTRGRQAKLADFGLAKASDSALLTQTGAVLGSPAYMAPEACRGEDPTPSGDLYALACSLWHALTGRPPYRADQALKVFQLHLNAPVPSLAEVRPDLAALDPLLRRCLAKLPGDRPRDAATLARELARVAAELPAEAMAGAAAGAAAATRRSTPARPARAAATGARRPLVLVSIGGGAALLLVLIAIGAATRHPPPRPDTPMTGGAAEAPVAKPPVPSAAAVPARGVAPQPKPVAQTPVATKPAADAKARAEAARTLLLRAEDQLKRGEYAAARASVDAADVPPGSLYLSAWKSRLRDKLARR